jgi:hypothetical protein
VQSRRVECFFVERRVSIYVFCFGLASLFWNARVGVRSPYLSMAYTFWRFLFLFFFSSRWRINKMQGNGPPLRQASFARDTDTDILLFSFFFLVASKQAWEEKHEWHSACIENTYIDYTKHKYVDNTTHTAMLVLMRGRQSLFWS